MAHRTWRGSGSNYSLSWGGQQWNIALAEDRPSVRGAKDPTSCYLSLEGVAASGRSDAHAFSSGSLIKVDLSRSGLEATYAPPSWSGLQVRATWTPVADRDGLDLEVQMLASSVGELKSVEVYVTTRLFDHGNAAIPSFRLASWVEPRDARSATLTYDGRTSTDELRLLATLPLPEPGDTAFAPVSLARPWPDRSLRYVEMVHPHDISRRIVQGPDPDRYIPGSELAVRYALFGHDLEKGVVVRGRLRGLWIPTASDEDDVRAARREFLALPPPLGT